MPFCRSTFALNNFEIVGFLVFFFFCHTACSGILLPWPEIELAPPEVEAGVLITGSPGKSHRDYIFSIKILRYLTVGYFLVFTKNIWLWGYSWYTVNKRRRYNMNPISLKKKTNPTHKCLEMCIQHRKKKDWIEVHAVWYFGFMFIPPTSDCSLSKIQI